MFELEPVIKLSGMLPKIRLIYHFKNNEMIGKSIYIYKNFRLMAVDCKNNQYESVILLL